MFFLSTFFPYALVQSTWDTFSLSLSAFVVLASFVKLHSSIAYFTRSSTLEKIKGYLYIISMRVKTSSCASLSSSGHFHVSCVLFFLSRNSRAKLIQMHRLFSTGRCLSSPCQWFACAWVRLVHVRDWCHDHSCDVDKLFHMIRLSHSSSQVSRMIRGKQKIQTSVSLAVNFFIGRLDHSQSESCQSATGINMDTSYR